MKQSVWIAFSVMHYEGIEQDTIKVFTIFSNASMYIEELKKERNENYSYEIIKKLID